jgi:2-polyprenyl-3-methyl-5-hydroxy-6-metoxy-1,4-benzoquinol methylase
MGFDYQHETKDHYKSVAVASRYHASFSGARGWRTLRARSVATRERAVVAKLLQRVPHGKILDLPAGTGKLAPIFAALGGSVVACDISPAMLEFARREYPAAGCTNVDFRICDAEQITRTLGQRFDVAVCLRLLHRVPSDVRGRILAELAACADHAIVSMGIESGYHRGRRHVRSWLFGSGTDDLCFKSFATFQTELKAHFEILAHKPILPGLSQEMIFLLRSRIR